MGGFPFFEKMNDYSVEYNSFVDGLAWRQVVQRREDEEEANCKNI